MSSEYDAFKEHVCPRCHRVCFSKQELEQHECFDIKDKLDAEIAVCNWDGKLFGEPRGGKGERE